MSGKKGLDFVKTVASYMVKGDGFDKILKSLVMTQGGDGACQAEFKVAPEHLNRGGTMHGGFTATVVDVVTTYALMTNENAPPGVSVDLHISYLKGAREGEDVIVDARTIRAGKNLAYLECELRSKKDNSILAKGLHTKFVGQVQKRS